MSNVFFISDLHLYHGRIIQFAGDYRWGDTWEENLHNIIVMWNARVRKRDKVFVLGDVVMGRRDKDEHRLEVLNELSGNKVLLLGNHDYFRVDEYLKYFTDVMAYTKYKGYWVNHIPIHKTELYGKKQIHGHSHQNSIRNAYGELDKDYINVSIECTDGAPVPFDDIKSGLHTGEPIRKF